MEPITISGKTQVSVALSMLMIVMLSMPFRTVAAANALPGCPESCGSVQIPYPFGIGPNCSRPGFQLSCKGLNNGSLAPFLLNELPVLKMANSWGALVVGKSINPSCQNQETSSTISNNAAYRWSTLSGTPYWIQKFNWFTVIGCDISANFTSGTNTGVLHSACTTTGCYGPESTTGGICTGLGCCQIFITEWIKYYEVNFQRRDCNNSSQKTNSSQCNYLVLTDDFFYDITTDDITTNKQMAMSLVWSIGKEDCKTAQANKSSYACISDNSRCMTQPFGGYKCHCVNSAGNPYLEGGCGGKTCSAFTKQNSAGNCQIYMAYVMGT